MLKYINFIIEKKKISKTTNTNNPKFDFIYSKNFGDVIGIFKINPISKNLILSYDNIKTKYTYIDITKEDDIISYMDAEIAKTLDENVDVWHHNGRKEMKIGRMINKLFTGRFEGEILEKFVNQYKSVIRENKTFFKIYKGDSIKQWYNEENTQSIGTLGNSCMRYDRCEQYLELYAENPEKIQLLVLFDKDSSLEIGRTLLWYLDSHQHIMMDRIYTSKDSDINLFKRYAIDNGISLSVFDDNFNGLKGIYTKLKPQKYDFYPYLDTLFIYQPETGIITDTIRNIKQGKSVYVLDDIYGTAREHKI